jgi:hypothetical protein
MAFSLPDGSKFYLGTTFGAPITVSGISNADPAVATANAHGLAANKEILLLSGWEDANETVFRVGAAPNLNDFKVDGLDSSNTSWFAAGTGGGSAQEVTAWQEITQLIGISASGGDPQYATVELLSRRNAINIPTRFNPTNITLTMADDPTLAGFKALQAATRTLSKRAFKVVLAGGGVGYGYGYVALNEMPSLNKGQVNSVTCTMSLLGKFMRYAAQ